MLVYNSEQELRTYKNIYIFLAIFVAVPDPPTALRQVKSTPVSLTVQWSPGWNGGPPQTFTLTYNNLESDGKSVSLNEIPDSEVGFIQYKLTDEIQPDSNYRIEISTQNRYGSATSSIKGTFKTLCEFFSDPHI